MSLQNTTDRADDFPIVAIGASAGGLEACRLLLDALPPDMGMAFILIQHLDPTHESMLVELLAAHTSMVVLQPSNGQVIQRNHFYIIPPETELTVRDGRICLAKLPDRRGVRLPFDALLQSLATHSGREAVCIVLSGTGSDGSAGLVAIKKNGGFVIAQDPDEADSSGMPESAIQTGDVDLVLSVSKMPEALVAYRRERVTQPDDAPVGARLAAVTPGPGPEGADDALSAIIELIRTQTAHDFTHYKPGTLRRRIELRMARATIAQDDLAGYLTLLQHDGRELELLASDLLIKVTKFFRDPQVFEWLADKIIPDLLRTRGAGEPVRIWVAGCSTDEETYSVAMVFREQMTALGLDLKLQIFASDVDPHAVATAREGVYGKALTADVSPARLARFFSKAPDGYHVAPELRACVVFAVQDVLGDPPFSRLDLVSCRNLLIYLRPEAQATVITRFHFALRDGGILMLGNAESIDKFGGLFEPISKSRRLYRRIGHHRIGDVGSLSRGAERARGGVAVPVTKSAQRPVAYADLCQRLVLGSYAPATVLVNRSLECLYTLGPIDTYLQVAPGTPMHDVLAMARAGVKAKLRTAITRAFKENTLVEVAGRTASGAGADQPFKISVQPVINDGAELLLICFTDAPHPERNVLTSGAPVEQSRVAELERELEMTRTDLQDAVRGLEASAEEQKIINEEALSINEEFQSTNEELLTSKEELQSLNEELTALNSQLQDALERQRTTSNDLQNVLNSTDVATIFLDPSLNIRFFTPATRSLFNVIPSDIGRALGDLKSLADDDALLTDARTVLRTSTPIETEVETAKGAWYIRRVLPYRTPDHGVEGVVITFADITDRRHTADVLAVAKRQADLASLAKSRFLSTASHDLRQPLQTLTLVQALLTQSVTGPDALKLVARLETTVNSMSGMLNALLDSNAIESGTVQAKLVPFPIDDLLERMRDEFAYVAQSKKIALRFVPSGMTIVSDPRLLEQMIRNLLSNAFKYTRRGKVLLGCRRRNGTLHIEVWDTGVGIPPEELESIFEEYHQVDHGTLERNRGLGLGLAIVQRLGQLLNHRVSVRSQVGRGSVFAVEVPLLRNATEPVQTNARSAAANTEVETVRRTGTILVVEDDPEVRELLQLVLTNEGHRAITASDGAEALGLVTHETVRPDLILADYGLPNGMSGLQVTAALRTKFQREIPTIVLSGDISTDTLREIALQQCVQLNKPVKVSELTQIIQRLLPAVPPGARSHVTPAAGSTSVSEPPVIFVIDDDAHVRDSLRRVVEATGRTVEDFASCEEFLEAYQQGRNGCLLIDAYLPGMNGLELLRWLKNFDHQLPSIMITGNSDVSMAVQAMKAGALDFLEKPVSPEALLASIDRALEQSRDAAKIAAWQQFASNKMATLTSRQQQILKLVLAGQASKNIAVQLGISQRTVENHRASIMQKTGASSLPALARLAVSAEEHDAKVH